MSIWNDIRKEFQDSKHKNIRQKYIKKYVNYTGRNLLIYASEFVSGNKPGHLTILDHGDKNIIADSIRDLDSSKGLDFLIESPGGLGEVAESIAIMLRSRFDSVRFIVPNMAKSAATVLCLSGDKILMNEQSELGPIDPQMPMIQPNTGIRYSPAQIIIQQFQSLLQTASQDTNASKVLAPYLQLYFPSFLQECFNAIEFVKTVAIKLLTDYMFKNEKNGPELAKITGEKLGDFGNFLSHARSLNIDYVRDKLKLNVLDLREDPQLDHLVNTIFICIKETFNQNSAMFKLCENSKGHGSVRTIAL